MNHLHSDLLKEIFTHIPLAHHALYRLVCLRWSRLIPRRSTYCLHYINDFKLMRRAYYAGCPLDPYKREFNRAILIGNLDMIEWLHAQGCNPDYDSIHIAVQYGHLEIVQYLVQQHKCYIHSSTFNQAAARGHLHVLKWLYSVDRPYRDETCQTAASKGKLDVLQWGRLNLPWNRKKCLRLARRGGHKTVLAWIEKQRW
jgi:Ankyrin repeats (3 copies)